MKCGDYDLRACRDKVFDRLCEIWRETKTEEDWENDIWRKANTLQAVAQYWHTITDPAQRQKAMGIMKDGYEFYLPKKTGKYWVDDFGWWGGFFTDLFSYTAAMPLPPPFDQANLKAETEHCYDKMLENLDPKQGGIWNHTDSGGQKNTVTNGWMLNLASNLFWMTGNAKYKSFAEAQYTWLTTGKYKSYSPPSWHLYASKGFLLWLPGPVNTSDEYWSGDEGVFLRGLTPYINGIASPQVKQELLRNSQKLITAAITAPNGFVDTENVMHESPNPPDWSNDLATGKGVFMRLVTRFAYQHNFLADKIFEDKFKQFVNATAESVWCSCEKTTSVTASNWNPPFGPPEESNPGSGGLWPQVLQTNGLDALNAAVQIRGAA
jgi:hypothetical protein